MYPPTVLDAAVKMSYPPSVPPEQQLAIGQEVFGLLPGLSMYATLWLREHNRVCDILKQEHPTWGDEQLFQTTRLIIIGKDFLKSCGFYFAQELGMFISVIFPNRQPTLVNRLLTVNRQDYFKLEQN